MAGVKSFLWNVVPPLLIVGWAGSSIWAFAIGSEDWFQRLGSVGVAIYFAVFTLLLHEVTKLSNASSNQVANVTQISLDQIAQNVVVLNRALEFSVEMWKLDLRKSTEKDDEKFKEFQERLREKLEEMSKEADGITDSIENGNARIVKVSEATAKTSTKSQKAVERVIRVQITPLVAATLQWGFGDLLVQWLR